MKTLLQKKPFFFVLIIGLASSWNLFSLGMTDGSYFSDSIQIRYLSPKNHDGVQDQILVSLPNELLWEDEKTIESVAFKVYDVNGKTVFDYQGPYDETHTYFYAAESNDQKGLRNGVYLYSITAYYDDGTQQNSSPVPIIVDNTTPMGVSAFLELSVDDITQAYMNKNIDAVIQGNIKQYQGSPNTQMDMMSKSEEALDMNDLPQIFFTAFSSSVFSDKEHTISKKNLEHISRVAYFLNENPNYNIEVIGHAASLLSGAAQTAEQRNVLIPLSLKRAEAVRDALLLLGVDSARIQIKGIGNSNPLSQKGERDYYAKNRRVEFKLQK